MTTAALKLVRDQIKAKLDERSLMKRERDILQRDVDGIIDSAESERRDLSDDEFTKAAEIRTKVAEIDVELKKTEEDLDGLEQRETMLVDNEKAKQASDEANERWARRTTDGEAPVEKSVGGSVRVKNEPRTYSKPNEIRGVSFFRDLYSSTMYQDPNARDRLERHAREARVHELAGFEHRASTSGEFSGLTVPQYLTDMAAPLARAMRPFVNITNRHPLPADGMSVNISRITTGSAVAAQATENTTVQDGSPDDTLLTVPVRTYSGKVQVSRQALDRGTGVDDIITQDLQRAHWTSLDGALLNGAGTSGTHTGVRTVSGIVSVTYTDTSPSAAELYPKLADLIQQIQSAVFMGVTHFVMHPRRWWWLAKEVGTTFPFLHVLGSPTVQAGETGGTSYEGTARNVLGIDVVVDGNMLTNLGGGTEDVIIGVTAPELHLWMDEGAPLFIRAEQQAADALSVIFVAYSYSAFTAGRYPSAHGVVTGSGLAAPTF